MTRRTERLSQRLAIKYNTNYDLVRELLELIGKDNTVKTLEMQPADLDHTARVNLNKTTRENIISRLATENIKAKPINNIAEGIKIIKGSSKIGSSVSYLNGEVMPQGLGSMLTVEALDPQPGEFIVDLAAAPGGKSCFIAERMENSGKLLVNDPSYGRYKSLLFNLSRHGIDNVLYSNKNGLKVDVNGVNRILLDAPCTGGGLLVSKPERKVSRNIQDSMQLQRLQIQLLKHALSLLDPGGICVYATCAISPLENEAVVKHFTDEVEFSPLSITGEVSYVGDDPVGIRLFPHKHACDGFFIVKMVKQ